MSHAVAAVSNNGASPTVQAGFSDDAISWSAATSTVHRGNGSAISWSGLAYSPSLGRLVTVAKDTPGAALACMTSDDFGATWTARTMPTANAYNDVIWEPSLSLFVAVGASGDVATSPDGITWTARTAASASAWQAIAWSPVHSIFVVVGNTTNTMISSDGINWSAGGAIGGGTNWVDICWCGGTLNKFLAAGAGTDVAATSTDGTAWTNFGSFIGNSNNSTCCAWSEDLGVALMGRSTTGITHTTDLSTGGTTAQTALTSLCWSHKLQLFVGVGSNFMNTSPDGTNWTSRTPPTTQNFSAVMNMEAAPLPPRSFAALVG